MHLRVCALTMLASLRGVLSVGLVADGAPRAAVRACRRLRCASPRGAAPAVEAPPDAAVDGRPSMDEIVNVCKRRGFIFQSSEVYGGFAGFFDYGPLGVELRANIKKAWWRDMVHRREDVVGLDSSIIAAPAVWQASGHVDGFSDPMVDCKESKLRYRADQLFWARADVDGETLGYVSVLESGEMEAEALAMANKMKKKAKKQGELTLTELKDFTEAADDEQSLIPSPATGKPGSLTPPRDFNLMFQTNVGPLSDTSSVAYLRPETAQGIFTNFKNVVATGRVKVRPLVARNPARAQSGLLRNSARNSAQIF